LRNENCILCFLAIGLLDLFAFLALGGLWGSLGGVACGERGICQGGVLGDGEGGGSGDEEKTKWELNSMEVENG